MPSPFWKRRETSSFKNPLEDFNSSQAGGYGAVDEEAPPEAAVPEEAPLEEALQNVKEQTHHLTKWLYNYLNMFSKQRVAVITASGMGIAWQLLSLIERVYGDGQFSSIRYGDQDNTGWTQLNYQFLMAQYSQATYYHDKAVPNAQSYVDGLEPPPEGEEREQMILSDADKTTRDYYLKQLFELLQSMGTVEKTAERATDHLLYKGLTYSLNLLLLLMFVIIFVVAITGADKLLGSAWSKLCDYLARTSEQFVDYKDIQWDEASASHSVAPPIIVGEEEQDDLSVAGSERRRATLDQVSVRVTGSAKATKAFLKGLGKAHEHDDEEDTGAGLPPPRPY